MLSGEATNINFIVFGLTQPGLVPLIYHTRGEHANHYTTNVVQGFTTYTHLLRSGSSTVSSNVIPKTAQSWANGINVSLPIDLAITDSVSVKS